MIKIEKVAVQIGLKLFTQRTKQLMRIQTQVEKSIVKTKNDAKIIGQSGLQWDQVLQLPLMYGKEMPFQIYERHQFGYNPEQIHSILHGKIVFVKGNKLNNWEIFDANQNKIGYLSFEVKSRPVDPSQLEKLNEKLISSKKKVDQTQLLIISSIVANLPSVIAKRAYATISIGDEQVKTNPSKSRSGQLVFVQKYELERKVQISEGIIDIYSYVTDQPDQKVATAIVNLQSRIDRKLNFCDTQGNTIGQGFIDGKIQLRRDALADRIFSSMIKQSFRREKVSSDFSKSVLSNKSFMKSRMVDSGDFSSSRKRVSVINGNSNIKIPQQRRFLSSRDPANNKCSYLPEQTFQFKQKNVDRYYRGASIGYGGKVDFTLAKKDTPSVGRYHLPSIWDKY